jgi:hypothetical protein
MNELLDEDGGPGPSEAERSADTDHRRAACMEAVDDLGVVDA